jgi:hypothetical protein
MQSYWLLKQVVHIVTTGQQRVKIIITATVTRSDEAIAYLHDNILRILSVFKFNKSDATQRD